MTKMQDELKHKLALELVDFITSKCDKSWRYAVINHTPDGIGLGHVLDIIDKVLNASNDKQGWKSMDSAPRDGEMILVTGGIYGCDESGREISQAPLKDVQPAFWMQEPWQQWVAPGECNYWFKPTHWQPLPIPPTNEKV